MDPSPANASIHKSLTAGFVQTLLAARCVFFAKAFIRVHASCVRNRRRSPRAVLRCSVDRLGPGCATRCPRDIVGGVGCQVAACRQPGTPELRENRER